MCLQANSVDCPRGGEVAEGLGVGKAEVREAQGWEGGSHGSWAERWTVLRVTYVFGRQQADVNEVPVIGYQGHHFKGQVGPWVLECQRKGGKHENE